MSGVMNPALLASLSLDNALGLGTAVVVIIYLLVVLFHPERF